MTAPGATDKQQWVIWNASLGVVLQVCIGRVLDDENGGRHGFLESPFDFVGPFNLHELEIRGRLIFGACVILSRQRWREDQADLRREAHEIRRAQARRFSLLFQGADRRDAEYRELLNLPPDGALQPSEIKAAFRRSAKIAHPDTGGSNEQFHRIAEARDVLLERAWPTVP